MAGERDSRLLCMWRCRKRSPLSAEQDLSPPRTDCIDALELVMQLPRQGTLVCVKSLRLSYAVLGDATGYSKQQMPPPEPKSGYKAVIISLLLKGQMLAQAWQDH